MGESRRGGGGREESGEKHIVQQKQLKKNLDKHMPQSKACIQTTKTK